MLTKTLENIQKNSFSIDVFGLGYVGFPLAVRLASSGFRVIGVDINPKRIERLKNNELMDSELHLKNEFLHCREINNLELVTSPKKSENPKIGIISVHTPIPDESTPSNKFVKEAIENFLSTSAPGDVIILESSVGGGTTDEMQKVVESKGYKIGVNYGFCFCPERIDPQNKKWHLENIPRIIYCSDDTSFKIAEKIYKNVNKAHLLRVDSPRIAEVVKSYENAFRLVNISLVNELAILCDKLGINVMDVIKAAATKPFGFMPFYPSAGAGGHCIPKDPRFLLDAAKKSNVKFSTIENALQINLEIPKYICNSIQSKIEKLNLEKSVLICGLTYKPDVEDMRDSPGFKLLNEFKNRNFKVSAYDPYFKKELLPKYLKENYIEELEFEIKNDLDANSLANISCLCIVQHHTKSKYRLMEIYEKSLLAFIYDCQNHLERKIGSKTVLDSLGS
jgi:UDP-N-acetyl-D-glucosamine dehydrogenase